MRRSTSRTVAAQLLLLLVVLDTATAHVRLTYPLGRYIDLDFLDNARTRGPCGVPKKDSCTSSTEGLQAGGGAAVSDMDTFGCKNPLCSEGYPGYHIILHGNGGAPQQQQVQVNLQKACGGDPEYILVLMSGYPVTWVLTGFTAGGYMFVLGEGTVSQTSGIQQSRLYQIDLENINDNFLKSNIGPPDVNIVDDLLDLLEEKDFDIGTYGFPFDQDPASVNYAWSASSWTLTVGEECCSGSQTPVTSTHWFVTSTTSSDRATTTMTSSGRDATTITTTSSVADITSTESTSVAGSAGLSGQRIAGIAGGIGAVLLVVIVIIVVCCCCRHWKCVLTKATSQTTEPNTVQDLQTLQARAGEPAAPNFYAQTYSLASNNPTGGSQPSAAPVARPEQPPPHNDPIPTTPIYAQIRR